MKGSVIFRAAALITLTGTLAGSQAGAQQHQHQKPAAHSHKDGHHEPQRTSSASSGQTMPVDESRAQDDQHAGHAQHTHPAAKSAAAENQPALENGSKMKIPDLEVLDQDGRKINFYSDLVKGKTVAINFIFTTCTTVCPPLGATFARVQKEMGERVGKDLHFISISVDPVTDTPERLKAWGAKFKAGRGWTFVTGDKQTMDKLLNALAASVARREDHSPTVIIGNDTSGVWKRTYGLAKPSQLVEMIVSTMDGSHAHASTKESGQK